MDLNEYQEKTKKTATFGENSGAEIMFYLGLGIADEAGEVAGKLKKFIRDCGVVCIEDLSDEQKRKIEKKGGKVYTGTMVLRGLGAAIRSKTGGYSHEQLIADTLRMFGQGTKVCVEIVAMASDAGLIPSQEVIAVAGTGRGADTAVLIQANSSNYFFDIKILEYLVKPRSL